MGFGTAEEFGSETGRLGKDGQKSISDLNLIPQEGQLEGTPVDE